MPCVIPGYEEAVEEEQKARIRAYLNQPEIVCGEPLRNVTPHLLAVLIDIRSPFYCGGSYGYSHVAQFLCALHTEVVPDDHGRRRMLEAACRMPIEQCAEEIDAFLKVTFLDSPCGGSSEVPIASPIAWLVYRFRSEPFRMTVEEIMNRPLRILYQELRCWNKENGVTVRNRSDLKKSAWLEEINRLTASGELTEQDLAEANERWRREQQGNN